MDNIGPIALFILYMAISAWAKKNKAQRRAAQEADPEGENPPQASFMGGIFEQLKKELLEEREEPHVIPYEETVVEPEIEVIVEDLPTPRFKEGSESLLHKRKSVQTDEAYSPRKDVRSLEVVLEPYSRIQQGIIMHEILGKPRAYQKDDEWFHKS